MNNTQHLLKLGLRTVSINSPTILTALAVTGVVGTVLMGMKARIRAMDIRDAEYELQLKHASPSTAPDDFTLKDEFFLTWKQYIPTVLMGGLTIACIIGANGINVRRTAALTSLYSLSETLLKEYEAKVVETIGVNKEAQIRGNIAQDKLTSNPVENAIVLVTGKGKTLCFDSLSGRYFQSDIDELNKIQNTLNAQILAENSASLNDLYYMMGLDRIDLGDDMGWESEHKLIDLKYSAKITPDSQPCIVIKFAVGPRRF